MSRIYDREYGTNVVGRYEDGKIYDREYGSSVVGRCDSGLRSAAAAALLLIL